MCARLNILPPPTADVSDSIGWVNDDILLLSLSLAAVLQKSFTSIATPLVFQSMLLESVPKVEASVHFLQSSRVFIPGLDSEGPKQPHATASAPVRGPQKQHSLSSGASKVREKIDSILQHPHVQHKNALSLRSFDVLEWLELAEKQLEAACSFETAEIPHLLLLRDKKAPPRDWSAKEQWNFHMRGGTQYRGRSSLLPEDVALLLDKDTAKNLKQHANTFEKEKDFDPLQLLSQMSLQHNKDASWGLDHAEKVACSSDVVFV